MKSIVCILGPTASGKSSLGMELARSLNGEIVSCDSIQVYRGFDIGSSKASPEEREEIPHHLIDIVEPTEPFHAGRFMELADAAIEDILSRGKTPLIVGGTNLYFRALIQGLSDTPDIPGDIRAALNRKLELEGLPALHAELQRVDPQWASSLPPTDTQRILRGLGVFYASGQKISSLNDAHQFDEVRYRHRFVSIPLEREDLYRRINDRVLEMMQAGFLDEVECLRRSGVPDSCKPMQAPGYLQLQQVLRGELELDRAVEAIQQSHRRYAKRQLTWLKRTPEVHWWTGPSSLQETQRWWTTRFTDRV